MGIGEKKKFKIRNNECYKDMDLRTALQWAKVGMLAIDGVQGVELWTNPFCQHKYIYYRADEVRVASESELQAFYRPYKDERNLKAKERRAKKKQREIDYIEAQERREKEELAKQERMRIIEAKKKEGKEYMRLADEMPVIECKADFSSIVIDTETTGLSMYDDEILQLSILSDRGEALYNSYIKPYHKESWWQAEAINGISPQMVANAPYPHEILPLIKGIVTKANKAILYNAGFDLGFLEQWGLDFSHCNIADVMLDFAPIYGEWNDYFENYKWQKLIVCAEYYGYKPTGDFHDSLEDCRATLYCYNRMKEGE